MKDSEERSGRSFGGSRHCGAADPDPPSDGLENKAHLSSGVDVEVLPRPDTHMLIVGMLLPPAEQRSLAGNARGCVTYYPVACRCRPIRIALSPAAALLEIGHAFLTRACQTQDPPLRHGAHVVNRKISSLADRIVALERARAGDEVTMEVLWTALARSVVGAFGTPRTKSNDGWMNPVALQRTVELVEQRLAEELSVGDMARAAGLSPSAFLRAFRGSTGTTPGEFLLARRIEAASRALEQNDLAISAVARCAGFKSSNHFATTFAARRGMSPSAYRRWARRSA